MFLFCVLSIGFVLCVCTSVGRLTSHIKYRRAHRTHVVTPLGEMWFVPNGNISIEQRRNWVVATTHTHTQARTRARACGNHETNRINPIQSEWNGFGRMWRISLADFWPIVNVRRTRKCGSQCKWPLRGIHLQIGNRIRMQPILHALSFSSQLTDCNNNFELILALASTIDLHKSCTSYLCIK